MKLLVVDGTVLGKRVLVRGDIDVPLDGGTITDDTRLRNIKPTIDYLLENKCQIVLCGHLGRPEGKVVSGLSSAPVQKYFPPIKVLENLRFDPREEANDESLARELAAMADIYVNEAFATSWEVHASMVGVPKLLPHFAGFRLAKELEMLGKVVENPVRPLVVVIGGVKLESKLPVITKMAVFADAVVVGGKLLEEMKDHEYGAKVRKLETESGGKDATLESINGVTDLIAGAKTIVWSGPLGVVEDYTYQVGSRRIAELITANTGAYRVVGGGDTIAFVDKLGLTYKFDWVSSGGGSMLKLLAGEKLPGIEALLL